MKVFYHADLDGECSAAVVRWYYQYHCGGWTAPCCPIDYKDAFPFHQIEPKEKVWIVDFSLQKPGDWARLLEITDDVVWIDHHKTAIMRSEEEGIAGVLPGLREWGDGAGCELTWRYCCELCKQEHPAPRAVELIGDYDTWTFRYEHETHRFKAYIEGLCDTRPEEGWAPFWSHLLPKTDRLWAGDWVRMLDIGACLIASGIREAAKTVTAWAFDVDFDGLRGIALNRRGINSSYFDSVAGEYDLLLPFAFDGKQWTVSIYRGGQAPELDCSEIAKRYGGGGHPGASGFQCAELPWRVPNDS